MRYSVTKWLFLLSFSLMLISCYTLIRPPAGVETYDPDPYGILPGPAMASSLGSGADYWDPWWEPGIAYRQYNNMMAYSGLSYYDPYNYYQYGGNYYSPLPLKDRTPTPLPERSFNRDDLQGNNRDRRIKNEPAVSSPTEYNPVVTTKLPESSEKIVKIPETKPERITPSVKSTPVSSKIIKPARGSDRSEARPVKKKIKVVAPSDDSGSDDKTRDSSSKKRQYR